MLKRIKTHWHELKATEPGYRFQKRYDDRLQTGLGIIRLSRIVAIVGGILICLIGVLLLVLPGPGLLVIILGLALIGSEIKPIAKFLDWMEIKVRRFYKNRPFFLK